MILTHVRIRYQVAVFRSHVLTLICSYVEHDSRLSMLHKKFCDQTFHLILLIDFHIRQYIGPY
jgi:hypothetical protein